MGSHVSHKITTRREFLAAQWALERFLSRVGAKMCAQTTALRKLFVAHDTLVCWHLSRVGSQMQCQGRTVCKLLAAHVALVRLFSRVDPPVRQKAVAPRECLAAHGALAGLLSRVRSEVAQFGSPSERLAAHFTLEGLVSRAHHRVRLLMFVAVVLVGPLVLLAHVRGGGGASATQAGGFAPRNTTSDPTD